MYPGAYCIEHLNAGTYILRVFGSDSSLCTTSRIDKIFDGYAKVRLLSAD